MGEIFHDAPTVQERTPDKTAKAYQDMVLDPYATKNQDQLYTPTNLTGNYPGWVSGATRTMSNAMPSIQQAANQPLIAAGWNPDMWAKGNQALQTRGLNMIENPGFYVDRNAKMLAGESARNVGTNFGQIGTKLTTEQQNNAVNQGNAFMGNAANNSQFNNQWNQFAPSIYGGMMGAQSGDYMKDISNNEATKQYNVGIERSNTDLQHQKAGMIAGAQANDINAYNQVANANSMAEQTSQNAGSPLDQMFRGVESSYLNAVGSGLSLPADFMSNVNSLAASSPQLAGSMMMNYMSPGSGGAAMQTGAKKTNYFANNSYNPSQMTSSGVGGNSGGMGGMFGSMFGGLMNGGSSDKQSVNYNLVPQYGF